ncbi:MAG: WecB/TagA/CpsF family glycosyltransferase [Alphaproteobacteria bacterium]
MSSLAGPFFETLARNNHKLMLIGGQPRAGRGSRQKNLRKLSRSASRCADHGYGDIAPKVAAIMNQSPDAVIVAMGAPRQEMLLLALRDAGYKGVAITCGGFLNQYLEKESYYPKWIDKLNLRFAYRLYKEPRRCGAAILLIIKYSYGVRLMPWRQSISSASCLPSDDRHAIAAKDAGGALRKACRYNNSNTKI